MSGRIEDDPRMKMRSGVSGRNRTDRNPNRGNRPDRPNTRICVHGFENPVDTELRTGTDPRTGRMFKFIVEIPGRGSCPLDR